MAWLNANSTGRVNLKTTVSVRYD